MRTIFLGLASLVFIMLACGPVTAWSHANHYGGSTEHVAGVGTEHTSAWGTGTAHVYGGGAAHTNVYGGTTAGRYGEGAVHTDAYGGATYHPPAPYYPYHPPVAVPYYSSSGCTGCAAAVGAVAGMAVGAAAASANTAAATSAAYSAGVAAGAAGTPYAMGVNYAAIPPGCATPTVQGKTYYLCGNTWFQPLYGANGVYYRVVPTP